MASDACCRHSGVACFSPAGGQGIWTVVLAPVDKSRSGGRDEISKSLSMANARKAEGPATAIGSRSVLGLCTTLWSPSWLEAGRTSRLSPSSRRSRSSSDQLLTLSPDSTSSWSLASSADGLSGLATGLGLEVELPSCGSGLLGVPSPPDLGIDTVFR